MGLESINIKTYPFLYDIIEYFLVTPRFLKCSVKSVERQSGASTADSRNRRTGNDAGNYRDRFIKFVWRASPGK